MYLWTDIPKLLQDNVLPRDVIVKIYSHSYKSFTDYAKNISSRIISQFVIFETALYVKETELLQMHNSIIVYTRSLHGIRNSTTITALLCSSIVALFTGMFPVGDTSSGTLMPYVCVCVCVCVSQSVSQSVRRYIAILRQE